MILHIIRPFLFCSALRHKKRAIFIVGRDR